MYLKRGFLILIVLLTFTQITIAQECSTVPKEVAQKLLDLCEQIQETDCFTLVDTLDESYDKEAVRKELESLTTSICQECNFAEKYYFGLQIALGIDVLPCCDPKELSYQGITACEEGNLEGATFYFNKAIESADEDTLSFVQYNFGWCYEEHRQPDLAIEQLTSAWGNSEDLDNEFRRQIAYNLGTTYLLKIENIILTTPVEDLSREALLREIDLAKEWLIQALELGLTISESGFRGAAVNYEIALEMEEILKENEELSEEESEELAENFKEKIEPALEDLEQLSDEFSEEEIASNEELADFNIFDSNLERLQDIEIKDPSKDIEDPEEKIEELLASAESNPDKVLEEAKKELEEEFEIIPNEELSLPEMKEQKEGLGLGMGGGIPPYNSRRSYKLNNRGDNDWSSSNGNGQVMYKILDKDNNEIGPYYIRKTVYQEMNSEGNPSRPDILDLDATYPIFKGDKINEKTVIYTGKIENYIGNLGLIELALIDSKYGRPYFVDKSQISIELKDDPEVKPPYKLLMGKDLTPILLIGQPDLAVNYNKEELKIKYRISKIEEDKNQDILTQVKKINHGNSIPRYIISNPLFTSFEQSFNEENTDLSTLNLDYVRKFEEFVKKDYFTYSSKGSIDGPDWSTLALSLKEADCDIANQLFNVEMRKKGASTSLVTGWVSKPNGIVYHQQTGHGWSEVDLGTTTNRYDATPYPPDKDTSELGNALSSFQEPDEPSKVEKKIKSIEKEVELILQNQDLTLKERLIDLDIYLENKITEILDDINFIFQKSVERIEDTDYNIFFSIQKSNILEKLSVELDKNSAESIVVYEQLFALLEKHNLVEECREYSKGPYSIPIKMFGLYRSFSDECKDNTLLGNYKSLDRKEALAQGSKQIKGIYFEDLLKAASLKYQKIKGEEIFKEDIFDFNNQKQVRDFLYTIDPEKRETLSQDILSLANPIYEFNREELNLVYDFFNYLRVCEDIDLDDYYFTSIYDFEDDEFIYDFFKYFMSKIPKFESASDLLQSQISLMTTSNVIDAAIDEYIEGASYTKITPETKEKLKEFIEEYVTIEVVTDYISDRSDICHNSLFDKRYFSHLDGNIPFYLFKMSDSITDENLKTQAYKEILDLGFSRIKTTFTKDPQEEPFIDYILDLSIALINGALERLEQQYEKGMIDQTEFVRYKSLAAKFIPEAIIQRENFKGVYQNDERFEDRLEFNEKMFNEANENFFSVINGYEGSLYMAEKFIEKMEEEVEAIYCRDTDKDENNYGKGDNPFKKGTTSARYIGPAGNIAEEDFTDRCVGPQILEEYFCSDHGIPDTKDYDCTEPIDYSGSNIFVEGCSEGACERQTVIIRDGPVGNVVKEFYDQDTVLTKSDDFIPDWTSTIVKECNENYVGSFPYYCDQDYTPEDCTKEAIRNLQKENPHIIFHTGCCRRRSDMIRNWICYPDAEPAPIAECDPTESRIMKKSIESEDSYFSYHQCPPHLKRFDCLDSGIKQFKRLSRDPSNPHFNKIYHPLCCQNLGWGDETGTECFFSIKDKTPEPTPEPDELTKIEVLAKMIKNFPLIYPFQWDLETSGERLEFNQDGSSTRYKNNLDYYYAAYNKLIKKLSPKAYEIAFSTKTYDDTQAMSIAPLIVYPLFKETFPNSLLSEEIKKVPLNQKRRLKAALKFHINLAVLNDLYVNPIEESFNIAPRLQYVNDPLTGEVMKKKITRTIEISNNQPTISFFGIRIQFNFFDEEIIEVDEEIEVPIREVTRNIPPIVIERFEEYERKIDTINQAYGFRITLEELGFTEEAEAIFHYNLPPIKNWENFD